MPDPQQPRCGQFTFYFSKCGHATSHKYHRAQTIEPDCNSNCIYDRTIDYWFWAGTEKRCSFCGLGQEHGFGTPHPIPESAEQRLILFSKVKEGMSLGEPDEVYNARFGEAAAWYNRKALEEIAFADARAQEPPKLSKGKLRTQRRLRHQNRCEVRRLKAKRRTEKWVHSVREEQYRAVKANIDVGKQPFIMGDINNPYMDIYSEVPVASLPEPIDNCAWCQYPLNDIKECGKPYCLPCGHMFHLNCVTELFKRRAEAEEKEVCKCPLCTVWFRDLRFVPDFYDRYSAREYEFDSEASSSVLSESDVGDEKGDPPPPWIFQPELLGAVPGWLENQIGTRSNLRLREIVHNSINSRGQAGTTLDKDNPSSLTGRRPGTNRLLDHFGTLETAHHGGPDEDHMQESGDPEAFDPNSTIPSPCSTETENGSLLEAEASTRNRLPLAPAVERGQARKRKARRGRTGSNNRSGKRPRRN